MEERILSRLESDLRLNRRECGKGGRKGRGRVKKDRRSLGSCGYADKRMDGKNYATRERKRSVFTSMAVHGRIQNTEGDICV